MDLEKSDLDSAAQTTDERIDTVIRGVIATHSGRPVDEVDTELRLQFDAAGVAPEEPGFGTLVQAIAAGDHAAAGVAPPMGPA